jgi:hypothetical protein
MTASGIARGGGEGRLQRRRLVANHAHVDQVDTEPLQHAPERVAVAVVDAARLERFADRAQLVAGREKRDAEPSTHRHLGVPERRQQAEIGRAQASARGERCRAAPDVFAGATAVVARLHDARRNADAIAFDGHELLRHDGVQAVRHDGAGHDADALALADGALEATTREAGASHLQDRVGIGSEGGSAQGIAVHGRVVLRRHVDAGDHVAGQDAAEARSQGEHLGRQHPRHELVDEGLCLGDRQGLRVVAGNAGRDLLQRARRRPQASRCSCWSSAVVLALAKACTSSNGTVAMRSVAVHASILRRPLVVK